jgi:hypothetical protein
VGLSKSGARAVSKLAEDLRKRIVVFVPSLSVKSLAATYETEKLPKYQMMLEWVEYIYLPLYDVVEVDHVYFIQTEAMKVEEPSVAVLESLWRSALSELLREAFTGYVEGSRGGKR